MQNLHSVQIEALIKRALEEDWGHGDWTTDLCVRADKHATARIIAKQDLMVAGADVAKHVFQVVDPRVDVQVKREGGESALKGEVLLTLAGPARAILKGERVALNFMGRMSGIATTTREYVRALEGTGVQILDTRKTTPGLRLLEKTATMLGGARNHRFGLSDGVMVKENHIRAAGGIAEALEQLRDSLPPTIKIEVETSCLEEVEQALEAGADIIMLDNMSCELMREAVSVVSGKALLEASGNVRLDNIAQVAGTGVQFVSTSAIVTAAPWADLSLLFDTE